MQIKYRLIFINIGFSGDIIHFSFYSSGGNSSIALRIYSDQNLRERSHFYRSIDRVPIFIYSFVFHKSCELWNLQSFRIMTISNSLLDPWIGSTINSSNWYSTAKAFVWKIHWETIKNEAKLCHSCTLRIHRSK